MSSIKVEITPSRRGCNVFKALLTAAFLLSLPGWLAEDAAAQTTRVPDCGYLNERSCKPGDNETYNIFFGFPTQCDFGLYVSGGKCVFSTRNRYDRRDDPWLNWALEQQRSYIGANVPVNFLTTLGTHNSYSSFDSGYNNIFTTNQRISLYDQLEAGARAVRIDPVYYYSNMRVCHYNNSNLYVCKAAGANPGRLYAYAVRELADWLDRHPGEFVVLTLNNWTWPSSGPDLKRDEDLIAAPLLAYVGRNRIWAPPDQIVPEYPNHESTSTPMPTLKQVAAAGKQLLIVAAYAFPDSSGRPLAFPDSRISKIPWAVIQPPYCGGLNNGIGGFSGIGEGRTASDSISPPVEYYLNKTEVRHLARCGVSMMNLDFLLGTELSILPVSGPKPDNGPDKRREELIWSFDVNDYGNKGAAVMKSNGRWTSDRIDNNYPYACVARDWAWPRRPDGPGIPVALGKVKITRIAGPFYMGQSTCQGEYGMDFFAPGTEGENEVLRNEYHAIDPKTGAKYGFRGAWLNYISTSGNLLYLSQSDVQFDVEVPGGAIPASQQVVLSGPPGLTIPAPAVVASGNSDVFVVNPGPITLDPSGRAIIEIAMTPGATANRNAGFFNNRIIFRYTDFSNQAGGNNSVISQAILNVNLRAEGINTLFMDGQGCQNSVCNVSEGQGVDVSILMNRRTASLIGFSGKFEVRRIALNSDGNLGTTRVSSVLDPSAFLIPGVGFLNASARTTVPLALGSQRLIGYYTGGLIDTAGFSNELTVNVTPFLNPTPQSVTLRYDPLESLPSIAGSITLNNPQNRTLVTRVECEAGISPCWLSAAVSGSNRVNLNLTASARSLTPGRYQAAVQIDDGLHAVVEIPVQLDIIGKLLLAPETLSLTASIAPVTAAIAGTVNGTPVLVSIESTNSAWLKVVNGRIEADPRGLALGQYQGRVLLNAAFASSPTQLTVQMRVVPPSTVGTNPPGIPFTVDGSIYTTQQTFSWVPGSSHTIGVPLLDTSQGTSSLFARWSDSGAASHAVTAPVSAAQSWAATFDRAYPLTAIALPVGSGSVRLTPAAEQGLYREGTQVAVEAAVAASNVFTGFRGDLTGLANPQSLRMDGAKTVTAQFAAGAPSLIALAGALTRSEPLVDVDVQLMNRGASAATGASIVSITGIRVLAGTGTVTPVVQTVNVGNIAPGGSTVGKVRFNWPAIATRIQFTVNFGDSSGYRGSTTMSLFR